MIQVEKVKKSFHNNNVLQNVSFEINKGDFVAVMGPSGSGKSTLLYSVSGMDGINEGKVMFQGKDITAMKEEELAKVRLTQMGFVFQNPQMLKNLTIYDNITLPGLVAKKESAHEIRKRATKLMKQMEIEGLEDRDVKEVSGGQLQRAAICRAMINHPEILFLDEPTGALNSEATKQVLDILSVLNQEGMTIMTVTHDARVAAKAKKVLYMKDGEIAASKELKSGSDPVRELEDWLASLN
jgi:putative ABC transport system ATP-binding protein